MRSGVTWLLRPKMLSSLGRGATEGSRLGRALLVAGVAALALPLAHVALVRLLTAVREAPEVGPLLASKLLGMGLLILLAILLLSAVIAALSSFFLSRDLPVVLSAPVDWLAVYGARLVETGVSSSWMVALLLVPVVTAYGEVYGAGPLYYAVAVLALAPLFVAAAAAGSAITLLLVRIFPARRTRDLLGVIAAGGVALLVFALRVLRPERLVDPGGYRHLVEFMDVLGGPTTPWFPSEWAAQYITGHLTGGGDPLYLLLLWSTAGAMVVLGAALHGRLYGDGFTRAQEGSAKRIRYGIVWHGLERVLSPLGDQRREMILKDARTFFRDATQWSQLIILGILVAVYVYNIRVLPLQTAEGIGRFLVTVVAFLNVALAGFVLAAVAARFIFPALSLEGRTLWLLRSSPLRTETLLWSKFWTGAVPLVVLALLLSVLTSLGMGLEPGLTALGLVTVGGLTLAFTAQALAWGVAYPKFESENAAQIPTSVGGLLFMLGALVFLAAVLAVQFWLLRDYLASGLPGRTPRSLTGAETALALGVTVALCAAATLWPYREARRRLARLEAG